MRLKLPALKGLQLFATVARCGSFKLAAQELNLTPGAVSHGIKSSAAGLSTPSPVSPLSPWLNLSAAAPLRCDWLAILAVKCDGRNSGWVTAVEKEQKQ
jgi:hypothetical protein